jgi:hypothetical protein
LIGFIQVPAQGERGGCTANASNEDVKFVMLHKTVTGQVKVLKYVN